MFVISQIRCISTWAMHAAAVAMTIDSAEMSTTRRSTSDDCAGTAAASSAGPIDGDTGKPSVVEARSMRCSLFTATPYLGGFDTACKAGNCRELQLWATCNPPYSSSWLSKLTDVIDFLRITAN